MTQRFTDTEKWKNLNIRKLSAEAKLLYLFILDNCDMAGFWDVDLKLASFLTGLQNEDDKCFESMQNSSGIQGAYKELASRFIIDGETLWVRNFLFYQNNLPLNPINNAHRGILKTIKSHKSFGQIVLKEIAKQNKSRGLQGADKPLSSPISKGISKSKKGGVGENTPTTTRFCAIDRTPTKANPITIWVKNQPTPLPLCDECKKIYFELKENKTITRTSTIAAIEAAILKARPAKRRLANAN